MPKPRGGAHLVAPAGRRRSQEPNQQCWTQLKSRPGKEKRKTRMTYSRVERRALVSCAVLICLQDSHSILSSLNKVLICLSRHCHSALSIPPNSILKKISPVPRSPPRAPPLAKVLLVINVAVCWHVASRMPSAYTSIPRTTRRTYLCSNKRVPIYIHDIIVREILSSSSSLLL